MVRKIDHNKNIEKTCFFEMTQLLPPNFFRKKTLEYINEIDIDENTPIITEEKLDSTIRMFITESQSISEEVLDVMYYLMRVINQEIKLNKKDTPIIQNSFKAPIFGKAYTINWTLYDYYKTPKEDINVGAYVDFKKRILNIGIIKVGDEIDKSLLADSLQHELEHIFQLTKKRTDNFFNDKDSQLYNKALSLINEKNEVGRAIYLMFNTEQDAYANGLYAALINKPEDVSIYDIRNRSDAYRQIRFLRRFNSRIHEENILKDKEIIRGLSEVNRSIDWLRTNINKAIRRFARKIGNVESRYNRYAYG